MGVVIQVTPVPKEYLKRDHGVKLHPAPVWLSRQPYLNPMVLNVIVMMDNFDRGEGSCRYSGCRKYYLYQKSISRETMA